MWYKDLWLTQCSTQSQETLVLLASLIHTHTISLFGKFFYEQRTTRQNSRDSFHVSFPSPFEVFFSPPSLLLLVYVVGDML